MSHGVQIDRAAHGRPVRRGERACRALVLCGVSLVIAHDARGQSTVTLYGIIDTSVEITNTGTHTTIRMDSGSQIGTQYGLKGSEAIGAGYAIEFQLENGFSGVNGAAANAADAFSRQAWIGLAGPFGSLRFGLQHSPLYNVVACRLDAFCVASMASGFNNFLTIVPRAANSIRYDSPLFRGWSFQAMVSLRDPASSAANGIGGYHLAFEYDDGGPLQTEGGYQWVHNPGTSPTRALFYGLSYGFSGLRLYAAIEHATSAATLARNDMGVSARYELTAFDALSLGYTYLADTTAARNDADQFGAEYQHYLSKRTFLYIDGGYLRNRRAAKFTLNGAVVAGVPVDYPGAPVKGIQFGIEHHF